MGARSLRRLHPSSWIRLVAVNVLVLVVLLFLIEGAADHLNVRGNEVVARMIHEVIRRYPPMSR